METPLICQTATPLQNGMILIAGGVNANGATTAAELYNPNTGAQSFSPTGSLNVARSCGSTATLLNDGTVLIAGGSGNTTAEIYIPSSGTFSLNTPPSPLYPQNPNGIKIGPMTAVRMNATATLLPDGTVLIAGGDIGDWAGLTSAEIYNPATGTFTATGSMSTRRTTQTATLLPGGTVLIAGGQDNYSGQVALNTAEIYTPSSRTFALVGNLTTTRCQHTATLLTDGTVLLAGGQNTSGTFLSSAEIYTPTTATFAATGSMSSPRLDHTATPIADGTVLVAGGYPSSSTFYPVNTAEIYTPSSRRFTVTGNMTVPRAYHSATMVYNGDILIVGGEDMDIYASSFLSAAELYSYPVTVAFMLPAYRVTSIIYAPPGNKSQSGFIDTTTNATTTTIGSSFGQGHSVSMSFGLSFDGIGISASQSINSVQTSSSTAAFQETFTDATGVSNASNNAAPDAINHNQDEFLIWLNPEIIVFGNESAPVSYDVSVQPLANGTAVPPDVVQVWADTMEANSYGVTTVPVAALGQQIKVVGGSTVYVPGLASICKNLIVAEYNPPSGPPSTCTLADQCGCTPADFLPILQTDPLLFYNGLTNPVSPYPGSVSPMQVNNPNYDQLCGTLPTPNLTAADCRYVPVPQTKGSSFQAQPELYGPGSSGGDGGPGTFMQGDNTQSTYTLGGQNQTTVSQSFGITIGAQTGSSAASECNQDDSEPPCYSGSGSGTFGLGSTMTWTDSQSFGTASGSGVSQSLTLNSGTAGCDEDVPIFEDTIYHTFVFQEVPNSGSTCTTIAPTFSIWGSPNSVTVAPGSSGTSTISSGVVSGFSSAVALTASGQPAGVTVSFSPGTIAAPGSGASTMNLTVASTTPVGAYPVTITATGGGVTQTATVVLTVAPDPNFTLSASSASVSVAAGSSGNSTITTAGINFNSAVSLSATGQPTDVTVNFSPSTIAAPGSGTSAMTLIVGSGTAAGAYPITVTGTGGGITQTATVTLNVPNFTISASPTTVSVEQEYSGTSTITTTVLGGFSSPVSLSATGQPTGVTVSFSPNPIAAPSSGTSTMTIAVASSAATGTYQIGIAGSGGGLTSSATISLTVTAYVPPSGGGGGGGGVGKCLRGVCSN
jgi:hypothetical protein